MEEIQNIHVQVLLNLLYIDDIISATEHNNRLNSLGSVDGHRLVYIPDVCLLKV